MTTRNKLMVGLLCGCVVLLGVNAGAATLSASIIDVNKYGTLSSTLAPAGVCCGPITAINSMVYLQNMYPSVYGTSLVAPVETTTNWNGGELNEEDDWYKGMIDQAFVLGSAEYMDSNCTTGTTTDKFIQGKTAFMDAAGVGPATNVTQMIEMDSPTLDFYLTHFSDQMPMEALLLPKLYTGVQQGAFPDDPVDTSNETPTWGENADADGNSQGFYDTGHYVNPFSIEWEDIDEGNDFDQFTDNDGDGVYGEGDTGEWGTFGFLDSVGGSPANIVYVNIWYDNGFLVFDANPLPEYTNLWRVDWALVQRKVPEPSTMLLLGTGLLGLCLRRRKP